MSKFKKEKKTLPPISTASLPDIVFMLLFFFMVSTTMRTTDQLVKTQLPQAKTNQKFVHKNLVSTIFIGKSRDGSKEGDLIQLDDRIATVKEVQSFINKSREPIEESERAMMTTLIKADIDVKMGTINDVKKELRDVDQLKISLATIPK